MPTLCEIARKVAKQQKTVLDEKQYIAHEIIACTFLMELVRDGIDNSTDFGSKLQHKIGMFYESEMKETIKKLEARDRQEQLLMFLTGPAGSGKSTAVTLAQQFCFEFCLALGVMWSNMTFFS